MPVPTDITAGTLTITNGSTAVTGVGTAWLASDLRQGDIILWIEGGDGFQTPILADVPSSNTALTLAEPWLGPTLTGVRYRIRYQWDSSRVSAQSRQLIEMLDNGNVLALSGLTGPGVPVFDGPHSMVIRPTQDFINGVAYDVQVDTLADRAAYDGQAEGFAVLVSDVGDGRSAIYSKASNTVGDWTDPAYVTGGIGPTPDIEATVTNTAPGTTPTVTPVPITGGTRLDFTLPEASGFYNAGVYDIGAAYTQDQVVRHNGSSFIALQVVPIGESPSSTMPPVDTAYWQVLAAKGQDGTGTGDVVGPASSVDGRLAAADGSSGKVIKFLTPEQATAAINAVSGDSGTGGIKGLVPAPGAGDAARGGFLSAEGTWKVPNEEFLTGRVGIQRQKPTICLTFDYYDNIDAYNIMFSADPALNVVGTYFVAPSTVGTSGFPTHTTLQAMKRDGWEIGVYSNVNMVTLEAGDRAAAFALFKQTKADMLGFNLPVVSFAAGSRAWNQRLRNEVEDFYSHVRVVSKYRSDEGVWQPLPIIDPLWVDRGGTLSLSTADTGASLSAQIDDLISKGGLWTVVVHRVADSGDAGFRIGTAAFTAFINKIRTERAAGNLRVVRFRDL